MSDDPISMAKTLKKQMLDRRASLLADLARVDSLISQVDDVVAALQRGNVSSVVDYGSDGIGVNPIQPSPPNPRKEDVAKEVRQIIESNGRPMPRKAIFAALLDRGVVLNGTNPEMVLSTMLWRAGEAAGLIRLPRAGYWLKDRPWPDAGYNPEDVFD